MIDSNTVNLGQALQDYNKTVTAWLEQSRKELAAIQKLQKAVANGNLRDLEKLRQAARGAAEATAQRAAECEPLIFDAERFLSPGGGFLEELEAAATHNGVRLYERDGVIFCYPVLVRPEPGATAVRIDKKLEFNLNPETLAGRLRKLQGQEPKARPERFIETLFEAYELVRAKRQSDAYIDIPLTALYEVLTLLPGVDKEYTLLDFTRDVYYLDTSGILETRKGYRMSLTASTVSRERSTRIIKFVTRDGHEKQYAAIKFTSGKGD